MTTNFEAFNLSFVAWNWNDDQNGIGKLNDYPKTSDGN